MNIKVNLKPVRRQIAKDLEYLKRLQPLEDAARGARQRLQANAPYKSGQLQRSLKKFRKDYPARSRRPRYVRIGVRAITHAYILNNKRGQRHYHWADRAVTGVSVRAFRQIERRLSK